MRLLQRLETAACFFLTLLLLAPRTAVASTPVTECVRQDAKVFDDIMKVNYCLVGRKAGDGKPADVVVAMKRTICNVGNERLYVQEFGGEARRVFDFWITGDGQSFTRKLIPPNPHSPERVEWGRPYVTELVPGKCEIQTFTIADLVVRPLEADSGYVLNFGHIPTFRKESETDVSAEAWFQRSKLPQRQAPLGFGRFRDVRLK
jgi:hypothetical protein